jgi:peptidoglycan/xylan/chitin deacetylase (PgdA/CDA1 family)
MKRSTFSTAVLLTALLCAPTTGQPSRAMVLTFDDLPYASGGQPDELSAAQRVTNTLIRVLTAHNAPAVAFVNERKLEIQGQVAARTALLGQWVKAGFILGNHTYSHPDFNAVSIDQFQDEIAKGDTVSRRLMASRGPYQLYFRHPQTHTGNTAEKKEAIERFLAGRGYKIAPHTIETSDFVFNVGYVWSVKARDQSMVDRLRAAYLDFALAATAFAEQITPQIFGRDIPQTLLIHANDITADTLDTLLQRLEARGYRFVTLDAAMADPAYATPDTVVATFGPTWLWRWMKSKGQNVSFSGDPEPQPWVMDLYRARIQK